MEMVRVRFVRTRLLALKLPWPLSCSDLGGSAAKVCAAHRSNNADDACDEGSEEPSAGETESAEAALEADPEVVVSRKTAAEVGWYHPHLLAFILLASPLARERSPWSIVAERRPSEQTPQKSQSFDVSTVKNAALINQETKRGSPSTKDARAAESATAVTAAAAAAEKAATAAEKSASAVEALATLKQKRELRDALKEAMEEESDEEEKGELKARYKKAKRAYLDACDRGRGIE